MIVVNHEAHQIFRLVGVEVVEHKDVAVLGMQPYHGGGRVGKIRPSPSRLDDRGFDLTRDGVTGRNKSGRSMANILKFPAFP